MLTGLLPVMLKADCQTGRRFEPLRAARSSGDYPLALGRRCSRRRIRMKILFVLGFGPIVQDISKTRKFHADTLGIPLEGSAYLHTATLDGAKHFAAWPLSHAAQSCFGSNTWPQDVPTPQGWLEFDVEDIIAATSELQEKGYQLLVSMRKEPWGQTVTRLLDPNGLLVGVTHTPALRNSDPA